MNKLFFGLILLVLMVSVVSADNYCTPPSGFNVTLDQSGIWYNFTIRTDACYVCIDNGAGYGDVDCTPCTAAKFTANTTCGTGTFNVQFNDTATDGSALGYLWEFEGGDTTTERNPIYTYNTTGVYDVSFGVTTIGGTTWSNQTNYITARAVGDTCVMINYGDEQGDMSPIFLLFGIGIAGLGALVFLRGRM